MCKLKKMSCGGQSTSSMKKLYKSDGCCYLKMRKRSGFESTAALWEYFGAHFDQVQKMSQGDVKYNSFFSANH